MCIPDAPEAVEDISAVEIQKIARGKLGKKFVKRRRVRYREASTQIQAGWRGRTDRAIFNIFRTICIAQYIQGLFKTVVRGTHTGQHQRTCVAT